ncbi:hypothetical protein [Thalassospira xiamenensis]|uniref:Uncharacterized protein n=1 Tax=Thalassospira xiamenensis TaxID=220697 RepID=A0A285TRU7_9PROT|nr:hypothetical protein [Thalassospira xiamenensis]SOC26099.1 hypothetical protein SAMN05428964_10549 [Thalassospira xiamenensis]
MKDQLRNFVLGMNLEGNKISLANKFRRITADVARRIPELPNRLKQMADIEQFLSDRTGDFLRPGDTDGEFDACNLLHWLSLAEEANVAFVEARPVLTLTEAEVSALSGKVKIAGSAVTRRLEKALSQLAAQDDPQERAPREPIGDCAEKTAQAMDDVPEGWMVRHVRAGPSTLKALAGTGLLDDTAPEVRFGPNVEVGPGWYRVGNRRRIDVADARLVSSVVTGPVSDEQIYVARPWITAARWFEGIDPHRGMDGPAGRGRWPAEWRVFVERGEVIGVANYYGWTDAMSPESAKMALEAKALAERIIDVAQHRSAVPVHPDFEVQTLNAERKTLLRERFPEGSFNCTLDFIESENGLLLLEGGPAFHPKMGGGHPCAFLGRNRPEGVCFQMGPNIHPLVPCTWTEENAASSVILTFEEAARVGLSSIGCVP